MAFGVYKGNTMRPSTPANLIVVGDLKFSAPLLANSPGGEKGKENALIKNQSLGKEALEGAKIENQVLYKKEEKVPDSFCRQPC